MSRAQDRKFRHEFTWLKSKEPSKLILIPGLERNRGSDNFYFVRDSVNLTNLV